MSKGRESLAFVEDKQVVIMHIEQILEFLLYANQGYTVAPVMSKTLPVPAFKIHVEVVAYKYMHEVDILGWTGIGAQGLLVSSDYGPAPGFWSRALI